MQSFPKIKPSEKFPNLQYFVGILREWGHDLHGIGNLIKVRQNIGELFSYPFQFRIKEILFASTINFTILLNIKNAELAEIKQDPTL